jgi:hypothetical protein
MEPFKVFVSSTSRDLLAERKAVAAVLRKSEFLVTAMEDWDAVPADATSVSVDGVIKCDIFVGIYAFRYGFIPPGSRSSITEQEYEMARREGKRCLCYFKDESSAHSGAADPELLEPDSNRQMLAAFKERIEKELVRGRYSSPEDLTTKLALDIARLEKGYLPGYTRHDLLERWAARGIETRNNLIHRSLSGHSDLLPSPLLSSWSHFINHMAWHREVSLNLQEISQLAGSVPIRSEVGSRATELAERLNQTTAAERPYNYNTVLAELDRAITEADVTAAEQLIQQLRRKVDDAERRGKADEQAQGMQHDARALVRELRKMREGIKDPAFRKCFPVIGSLGSGRTHFIASLLGAVPNYPGEEQIVEAAYRIDNRNFLVLLLDEPTTKSLQDTLLDGIAKASGLQWRTLEEFDNFLRGASIEAEPISEIRLGIAIDDLQRWLHQRDKLTDAIDELTRFISEHTHLYSLFWLFTLQDTSFGQIGSLNGLLQNYSYFHPELEADQGRKPQGTRTTRTTLSQFSGWLVLDDLNRDSEFGLRLIEKGLELQGASPPDPGLLRDNKAVLRNLLKPFIACVLLDLHFEKKLNLEHLATLSYMSFVDKFWQKRKDEFTTEYDRLRSDAGRPAYDDWSQALKLVAETLSQTGEFNPLQRDLERQVTEAARKEGEPSPESMAASALSALVKSGFLKAYKAPDPKLPDYEVQKVAFEFEPFWELRLAAHLRARKNFQDRDETAAKAELVNWFGVVEASEIEEGVLEFLLLLLDDDAADSDDDSPPRRFVSTLQQAAVQSEELPEEAAWFSGANATFTSQVLLMTLAADRQPGFRDRRVLHSLMYFLVEALPDADQPARRFKVLQPYYPAIGEESLSAYFVYIARRLLRQARDNREVLNSMHHLNQSEVMGVTEELALATIETLFHKATEHFGELNYTAVESILKILLDFLKASGAQASAEYTARGAVNRWERVFYREWVLRFFCVELVRLWGVDAYRLLADYNWYQPRKLNILWPVSVEMHREANFALGDWYRLRPNPEKSNSYIGLITQLVNSRSFRDRETAFYLIRHSRATGGQKGLLVDAGFAPMLEKIFLDPKLSNTVSRFYELFRINLKDFKALERRREKNLASSTKPGEKSTKPGEKSTNPGERSTKPGEKFWIGVKGNRGKGKKKR